MNRVCSIFSQLLQLFSRVEFEAAVGQHKAERHARGFTCWGQFVAMLFCQLGRAHSLREICQGLAASEGKLKHLGVPTAPSRSTLAYANQHRPWQLYQTVFLELLGRCEEQARSGRRKFRHLKRLLSDYRSYYNEDRTHLGLEKQTPAGRASSLGNCQVICQQRLGGLHHRYDRAA